MITRSDKLFWVFRFISNNLNCPTLSLPLNETYRSMKKIQRNLNGKSSDKPAFLEKHGTSEAASWNSKRSRLTVRGNLETLELRKQPNGKRVEVRTFANRVSLWATSVASLKRSSRASTSIKLRIHRIGRLIAGWLKRRQNFDSILHRFYGDVWLPRRRAS